MHMFYTFILLIVFGLVLGYLTSVLLPFSGIVGTWISGNPGRRSSTRYHAGVLVSTLFQTYFYLCYITFMISWASYRITDYGILKYLVWLLVFVFTMGPIWLGSTHLRIKDKERNTGYANDITDSITNTCAIVTIVFFIFVFFPNTMNSLWYWVPYASK